MATIRHHVEIDRKPDEVWALVTDSNAWTQWFPGMESVTVSDDGTSRTVALGPGLELVEDIVTNDAELRRFQYRISGGPMPVEYHLGTIDVLPSGGGTLVVYSTEVLPGDAKAMMDPAIQAGAEGLKAHCEA